MEKELCKVVDSVDKCGKLCRTEEWGKDGRPSGDVGRVRREDPRSGCGAGVPRGVSRNTIIWTPVFHVACHAIQYKLWQRDYVPAERPLGLAKDIAMSAMQNLAVNTVKIIHSQTSKNKD
ncbi:MAG: hypothetical protein ABSD13_07715 [Candidatus Korobacteraceae bacterium]